MKTTLTISSTLIACIFSCTVAQGAPQGAAKREAFRANAPHIASRQMERIRTDNGFTRKVTTTTADGRTATRNITVTRDPETQTRTRTIEGTNFAGESFSGQSTQQRTENGYTSSHQRTNTEGQTASSNNVVIVDQETGTATKTITRTNFAGETNTKTVVVER